MDIVTKEAGETRHFTFDFSPELATGENVTSVTSVTHEEAGGYTADLTLGSSSLATPLVTVPIGGGTAGRVYVVSCLAVTSAGQTLLVEGAIAVV